MTHTTCVQGITRMLRFFKIPLALTTDLLLQAMISCKVKECDRLFHNCLQLQAQVVALQASPSKVAAAEQQVQEARACAVEEVKKRQELVQTHAAELAELQQRLQAAQASP